uniref:Uncharacterized protein n=1 Tax=Rhizophora mucronata TaxID=61149 RepID=A0A2P2PAI3_RHIMU
MDELWQAGGMLSWWEVVLPCFSLFGAEIK